MDKKDIVFDKMLDALKKANTYIKSSKNNTNIMLNVLIDEAIYEAEQLKGS